MNIKKLILSMVVFMIFISACHKDLGDYEIHMPDTPVVTNLDSVYTVNVGDSLIITPKISNVDGADIELQWRISVMEADEINLKGSSFRAIFGLQAKRYSARLTVYNKTNGMKYFHSFYIDGATQFATGTTVLSVENGITQFSFIKPDGTIQARLYRAMQGKDLPADPAYLFLLKNKNTGNTVLGYFIVTKTGGVRLEANTMLIEEKYPSTLKDNFFSPPDELRVDDLQQTSQGVMVGIMNGQFYGGTTSTWDQAATYGMFGLPTEGDYELSPSFVMNTTGYFIAFDINRKQFLRFNLYGAPMFFGTQYAVSSTSVFDPTNVGMDLIHMEQLNGDDTFAYCKGSDGKIYELEFNVQFNGPFTFTPRHKRLFIRQDLITATTKWQGANNGVIYISSGTKVYRYNPLNEEVRELATDFGGKTVTMVKISEDQETLMVGTEGTIYYLDITTGKYGALIKKTEGIPGSPVDMAVR